MSQPSSAQLVVSNEATAYSFLNEPKLTELGVAMLGIFPDCKRRVADYLRRYGRGRVIDEACWEDWLSWFNNALETN